ncbi:MAG TPA: hypothetical protein DC009_01535 [Porphyromonadaceae bacterium]|nr:hypothetical protein [Porphyromonadaceae bacterium]
MSVRNYTPWVKVGMAVLLLLCLAHMPYFFYMLVRFVAAAAFVYLAYVYFRARRGGLGVLFVLLALLFQPFFRFPLGRLVWNVIDVAVAALLLWLVVDAAMRGRRR